MQELAEQGVTSPGPYQFSHDSPGDETDHVRHTHKLMACAPCTRTRPSGRVNRRWPSRGHQVHGHAPVHARAAWAIYGGPRGVTRYTADHTLCSRCCPEAPPCQPRGPRSPPAAPPASRRWQPARSGPARDVLALHAQQAWLADGAVGTGTPPQAIPCQACSSREHAPTHASTACS